jgi:ribosomal protein S27E
MMGSRPYPADRDKRTSRQHAYASHAHGEQASKAQPSGFFAGSTTAHLDPCRFFQRRCTACLKPTMSPEFLTLKCPTCGANLDVYPDMEQFTCGFCGTTVRVQRRGGTIALNAIEGAIRRVQAGTDKTAAELALPRLAKELDQALGAKSKLANDGCGVGCLVFIAGFGGTALLTSAAGEAGAAILMIGLLATFFLAAFTSVRLRGDSTAVDAQIESLKDQIRRNREIAGS